jgi:hypothetical protein
VSAVPEDAYRAAWKVIMSGGTLQAALEAAAPLMAGAERQRCAALLTTGTPMGFLRRHGLEPGAGTGQVLEAAAAEILAGGVDAPGRPQDGPSTVRAVPGGSGTPPDGSEPAETATAP